MKTILISIFMALSFISCLNSNQLNAPPVHLWEANKTTDQALNVEVLNIKTLVQDAFTKQINDLNTVGCRIDNSDTSVLIDEVHTLKTNDFAVVSFTISITNNPVVIGYAVVAKQSNGQWQMGPGLVFKDVGFGAYVKKCAQKEAYNSSVQKIPLY